MVQLHLLDAVRNFYYYFQLIHLIFFFIFLFTQSRHNQRIDVELRGKNNLSVEENLVNTELCNAVIPPPLPPPSHFTQPKKTKSQMKIWIQIRCQMIRSRILLKEISTKNWAKHYYELEINSNK